MIESLDKVKSIVISYNLPMSRKTEYIFLLTAHYCTGPNINNTYIGIPSTTDTDGVFKRGYARVKSDREVLDCRCFLFVLSYLYS